MRRASSSTTTTGTKTKRSSVASTSAKASSSSSTPTREKGPGRTLASRASPPPRDDFDEDVYEEATVYKKERNSERARAEVREENAVRKKQGLSALKLPPKFSAEDKKKKGKAKKDKGKSRRKRLLGSDAEDLSSSSEEDEQFEYEGQRSLGFDPLPILAEIAIAAFEPDEIIREHRRAAPSPPPSPRLEGRGSRSSGLPVELQGTVGMGLAGPYGASNIGESSQRSAVLDPEAKPSLDVRPDVKPCIAQNVKTGDQHLEPNTLGEDVKPDIKPSVDQDVKPDIKPDLYGDDDEEMDEEDYGDDDIVIVPSIPLQGTALQVKAESHVDQKPELFDSEEEEVYSDEEQFDSFDVPSSLSTQPFSLSLADQQTLEAMTERPAFPCTDEQRLIPPFELDPDDATMVIPASINRFLRDYQRRGVNFLYSKYRRGMGAILGDDMGLGKTVQVISFFSAIMRKTGTGADGGRRKNLIRSCGEKLPPLQWATALLVCPTSLIGNWARELDTWGYFEYEIWTTAGAHDTIKLMKGGYLDIILISHDLLFKAADELKKLPFSVIIVDEAHRMKKSKGRLSLAVKKIPSRSCFALTGTLIQNRMDEMWSVLDFVQRGWAGTLSEWRTYAVNPINQGHRHDGTIEQVIKSIFRMGQVYSAILPHFYLRRDKRLIANELPEKIDRLVLCPLGSRQEAVYKRIIESDDVKFIVLAKETCDCGSGEKRSKCCHTHNSVGDGIREAILKMFDALGRVANHMALLYQSKDDSEKVRAVNQRVFQFCLGEPYDPARHNSIEAAAEPDNCGKWPVMKKMLQEWRAKPEEGNKVLLFSNSVRLLKYIKDFMDVEMSGFESEIFSGEVDKAERMNIVDRFQDPKSNTFVLLVSTMAGGVGLNLTAANKVIIFDPNWNPANDLQAMDRAFRFGQKRSVEVFRFVSKGTIEEVMYERQIYKQQRARQLNDGTFERRTHKGFEGGQTKSDKGDLFGVHNIFRYNADGFVKGNLDRVRLAEAEVRQDFIAQDYDSASGDEEEDDDAKLMRAHRRDKALHQAARQAEAQQDSLMDEIMDDGAAPSAPSAPSAPKGVSSADELMAHLGINTMDHAAAFRDSLEERALYMKGIQILIEHPELASMQANDIGKVRLASEREAKRARRADPVVDEEPWKPRFLSRQQNKPKKSLVSHDDDDSYDE